MAWLPTLCRFSRNSIPFLLRSTRVVMKPMPAMAHMSLWNKQIPSGGLFHSDLNEIVVDAERHAEKSKIQEAIWANEDIMLVGKKETHGVIQLNNMGEKKEVIVDTRLLMTECGLEKRDLRLLDPHFAPNVPPSILSRVRSVVFGVWEIRCVIMFNRLILFDAFDPRLEDFIPVLQNRIQGMSTKEEEGVPFEHVAMEACLGAVARKLRESWLDLHPQAVHILQALPQAVTKENLLQAMKVRGDLVDLENEVQRVRTALDVVLSNDEDMASMYLTEMQAGYPRSIDDHESVEMMFEAYLGQVEALHNTLLTWQLRLKHMEGVVGISLDTTRNSMIRLELLITCGTFSLATAGAVTGIFGMNLLSGIEQHSWAFYGVVGSLATMSLGIFGSLYVFIRRNLLLF